VTIWGSGTPIREFLYVEDCADGILLAAEKYDAAEPLNIGTGVGTTIRELVETLSEVLKFRGEIVWDRTKPDGQAKKILEVSKMKRELDWHPRFALREGLEKTVRWYQQNELSQKPALRKAA
jgi:nucleoside-diphosphate-sugar epimerase